jgi:hypothetical protein
MPNRQLVQRPHWKRVFMKLQEPTWKFRHEYPNRGDVTLLLQFCGENIFKNAR